MIEDREIARFKERMVKDRSRILTCGEWHLAVHLATGIALPYNPADSTVYLGESKRDEETGEWVTDVQASLEQLRKVARFAADDPDAKLTKHYNSDEFELEVTVKGHPIRYSVPREVVCEKKVVGTKKIPAYHRKAYVQEIVEWDCNSVSLLKDE